MYNSKPESNEAVESIAALIAGMLTGKGLTTEGSNIASTIEQALGAAQAGLINGDDGIPKAYLNYIFFDKEMKYKTGGFAQVSEKGNGEFEELSLNFIPPEEGFIMVYTSNQTNEDLDVFFDDMTILHTSGPIIRVDDYYPFGLTYNTSQLTGVLTNKNLFNSNEFLDELSVNMFDFNFRMYEPALGRFLRIDPMAERSRVQSPFQFANNNPVSFNDPTGLKPAPVEDETWTSPTAGSSQNFGHTGPGSGKNWSDPFRSVEGNFAIMSNKTFEDFYGVDLDTDEGKEKVAKAIASEDGGSYVWCTYCGEEVKRGDGNIYYEGAWIPASLNFGRWQDNGFFNIWDFLPIDLSNYVGVFIDVSYYPSESDKDKYSDYNWIYKTSLNGNPMQIQTFPGDLSNQGPFYYGESYSEKDNFRKNNIYPPSAYSAMYFNAEMFYYGIGSEITLIGMITYGFIYSNNTLTLIKPKIIYFTK